MLWKPRYVSEMLRQLGVEIRPRIAGRWQHRHHTVLGQ
jgi:hypothetical protein